MEIRLRREGTAISFPSLVFEPFSPILRRMLKERSVNFKPSLAI